MVSELIYYLQTEINTASDPLKAPQMKAYMKNRFEFAGVSSPIRKEIIKYAHQNFKLSTESTLWSVVNTLWEMPQREYQYIAIEFLYKYRKLISENALPKLEYLIITKSWWDSVDALAADQIGFFFQKNPKLIDNKIEIWLKSENMWLQRTCIICQLFYGQHTNVEILKFSIDYCKNSNEFFIQKAIGWALRQYAKVNPDYVLEFVNANNLKPLSRREALKHF